MSRAGILLGALVAVAVAGCGGGGSGTATTVQAPSRAQIIKCVNHGGGIKQREVRAEIGALPAHDEIETSGLPEGGSGVLEEAGLGGAHITIDLFGGAPEGEEAAKLLAEEEPTAEVHSYAGGAVVSVIARVEGEEEGATSTSAPKDRRLVAKCVGA